MKIIPDLEQGSPEWFAARAGRATASCFADVMAKGQGKMRAGYFRRVVAERLTGKVVDTFKNAHTDRGQEQEPMARMAYEALTDERLERVGFIQHDSLMAGCSPDSLVFGKPRGVEVKCVLPHVQVETILARAYPAEHKAQIQGSMWITGFEEWDFCSYSPDMPAHLRTYIFTVKRDEAFIKELEAEVIRFLRDVDNALEALQPGGPDLEGKLRASLRVAA